MNLASFSKQMIINFIAAIVVTVIISFAAMTLNHEIGLYLGAFVGMYIFAVFGVDSLIDNKIIENNPYRFVLAIICVIIYAIAFVYIIPLVFGPDVIPQAHTLLDWGYDGIGRDLVLNKETYLALFGVVSLILNYYSYRN